MQSPNALLRVAITDAISSSKSDYYLVPLIKIGSRRIGGSDVVY